MDVSLFIARRLRFKGRIAMVSIAISFFVMILSVSISSGFRNEIRGGISSVSGDVQITPVDLNYLNESSPIERTPAYLSQVLSLRGVQSVNPVVYRAGIVKNRDIIQGVMFKGVGTFEGDSIPHLSVCIPSVLASVAGLEEGDEFQAYFIGDKVKVRKFKVSSVYQGVLDSEDNILVYASLSDMQRLNGWASEMVSALEISVDPKFRTIDKMKELTSDIGSAAMLFSSDQEATVVATSAFSRFSQIFDWLELIDFNVIFILILMTVVAGFNMISGLLIMLFENISTIGLLKALGMQDRNIARIFLASASVVVFRGMLYGNALALAFCLLQGRFHFLGLDPSNYFISFVPVHVDAVLILTADVLAYIVIMLLLIIPSLFISRVDPARTVRVS